jgi:hypothetical protein
MGVAGDRERDPRRDLGEDVRIVGEGEDGIVVVDAGERRPDVVGSLPVVADPRQPQRTDTGRGELPGLVFDGLWRTETVRGPL